MNWNNSRRTGVAAPTSDYKRLNIGKHNITRPLAYETSNPMACNHGYKRCSVYACRWYRFRLIAPTIRLRCTGSGGGVTGLPDALPALEALSADIDSGYVGETPRAGVQRTFYCVGTVCMSAQAQCASDTQHVGGGYTAWHNR